MTHDLPAGGEHLNEDVAVVGMACQVPGARTPEEFWNNLKNGVESISAFTEQDLLRKGVDPALLRDPSYVRAGAVLEDADCFDAEFFGYFPREAELMDPQHRVFLECAWQALERAGCSAEHYPGLIGVFAGATMNTYMLVNLMTNRDLLAVMGDLQTMVGNDKDYLSTRVSYQLDLRGPSYTVQTACSSSLVAIHLACQSLLACECDLALAGGSSVRVPQDEGYRYQTGGTSSPDGHCRAFDEDAAGSVVGSGAGVVVLKRLQEALADGDTIYAVIKGSAINNDGSQKVGFTAPSVDGQARVVVDAQLVAGVHPDSIGYVEPHGTGTNLGDPIEIAALTKAFRNRSTRTGYCAIGSVKTNIGHLDAAAGVAGFIKVALCLHHKRLVPSLNFQRPNQKIDFAGSPFYVNTRTVEWPAGPSPRRGAISSFGIGGTNAHVILEEAPPAAPSGGSRPWQLLTLSARTESALDRMASALAEHLQLHPEVPLADVAHTLHVGRKAFSRRLAFVCWDNGEAITALRQRGPGTRGKVSEEHPVVFLFPGQGAQYVHMGRELYQTEPTFREQIDHCARVLTPHLGLDLRDVLYPAGESAGAADQRLRQTQLTQSALFVVEYALARLWLEWGVTPCAMLGHSIGEYTAACLAGVFDLEDALRLVAFRGRLLQDLPPGAMLCVSLPEEDVRPLLNSHFSLAAVNAPTQCVVSGSGPAIDELAARLGAAGVFCMPLRTSHAFHSFMVDPVLERFAEWVGRLALSPPRIPYLSNVTGTWITPQEATDPRYWAAHLRSPVRFGQGARVLLEQQPPLALVEVGPGSTLRGLVQQVGDTVAHTMVPSLRQRHDEQSDVKLLLGSLGELWLGGQHIDWTAFARHERRRRVVLPTYPFERRRYWIEPGQHSPASTTAPTPEAVIAVPPVLMLSWRRAGLAVTGATARPRQVPGCTLVFGAGAGLGERVSSRLGALDKEVVWVVPGEGFRQIGDGRYEVNPRCCEDFGSLVRDLLAHGKVPGRLLHFGCLDPADGFDSAQERGLFSLLHLAQALVQEKFAGPLEVWIITPGVHDVTGTEYLQSEHAPALALSEFRVAEIPKLVSRGLDMIPPASGSADETVLIEQVLAELASPCLDPSVAFRGCHRWVPYFEPAVLPPPERGNYLILSGLGEAGLALAKQLAATADRLILADRTPLPGSMDWQHGRVTGDGNGDERVGKVRQLEELQSLGAEVLTASLDLDRSEEVERLFVGLDARFGPLGGVVYPLRAGAEAGSAQGYEKEFSAGAGDLRCLRTVLPVLRRASKEGWIEACLFVVLPGCVTGVRSALHHACCLLARATAEQVSASGSGRWALLGSPAGCACPTELARVLAGVRSGAFSGRVLAGATESVAPAQGPEVGEEDRSGRAGPGTDLHDRPDIESAYVAPRSDLEKEVATLWEEMLGIRPVGLHDNFFDFGGHSLLATQLISRVRQRYGVQLPIADFLQQPTVIGLADRLTQVLAQKPEDPSGEAETVEALLREIERLSPEEVKALLQAETVTELRRETEPISRLTSSAAKGSQDGKRQPPNAPLANP